MSRDSEITCQTCGHKMLVSFSHCLRKGWPKCCGYTMRLTRSPSEAAIHAAVGDAFVLGSSSTEAATAADPRQTAGEAMCAESSSSASAS